MGTPPMPLPPGPLPGVGRARVPAALVAVAAAAAWVSVAPGAARAGRLDPGLQRIHSHGALSRRFLTPTPGGEPVVNLLLEGAVPRALLEANGVEINTWTPAGATARCPLSRLPVLQLLGGVGAVHPASRCRLLLDRSAVDAEAASVRVPVPPGFAGQAGGGVLIGAVDSGVDLAHGDFRHPDGSTRLVSVWDQTTDGRHPAGFTYGTEWTAADINAREAGEGDEVGHGTHVLGIAAGDGSSAGHGRPPYLYVGMAPEADLCLVKTDLTISGIVDGINYIFQVAASRGEPAVVNLSLGTQEGAHDGTLLLDRLINQLTGPGRVVVAAAGNEGADNLHAQATLGASGSQAVTMLVPSYTPGSGIEDDYVIVSAWYSSSDQVGVTLTTPSGIVLGPVAPGDSLVGRPTADGFIDFYNRSGVGPNGDHEIYLQVYDATGSPPPHSGSWQFSLSPIALGGSGRVDAYIETSVLGNGAVIARWTQGATFGGVVNAPADADSVIAAGAYVTKVCWSGLDGGTHCYTPAPPLGSIARFSCQGPRRDGVPKPELSAPGMGIVSARAGGTFFLDSETDPDDAHVIQAGTSMSAPHVTGAVALYLAHRANALASPSQVRAALQQSARADGNTGAVPNATWGAGKLDVAALLGPALTVAVTRPESQHVAVFGQSDTVQVQVSGGTADSVVVSLSRDGGLTYPHRLGVIAPVSSQPEQLVFTPPAAWATYRGRIRCTAYNSILGDVRAFSDGSYLILPELATVLRPATPNPFRGSTTVHFELLDPGRATVRVFSVRGTLVRTLADGSFPAGRQAVDWDGTDDRRAGVSAGIYFCEFRSGRTRNVQRITLLR